MSLSRKTVLVIDNDASMRFALGRISLGPEVVMQFLDAGDWMTAQPGFSAVLADDSMLVGTEEKLPITMLGERLGCPVVLMTTSGNRRIEGFARDAGASSVLHKPFNAGELRRQLGAAIGGNLSVAAAGIGLPAEGDGGMGTAVKIFDYGGRIAGDQVFDDLFVELERRQPLDEGLDAFDVVERHLVRCALTACTGNQSQAARFLGITRNTLRKRIHKYGFASLLSVDDQQAVDGEQ